jgi:hypothetical protein
MLFFILIVIATALLLARMAGIARPGWTLRAVVLVAVWLGLTAALARTGVLMNFDRFPPPAGLLIMISFVLTTVLAFSPVGNALAGIPIIWLIGFQVFRVAVEIFLDWGNHAGFVPPQMTLEGRNWDILTGLSAIPMAWAASRGIAGRTGILIWNIAGTLLLLNVMGVAALSTPTRLFAFPGQLPNTFVAHVPYVWLPTFLVQAAWFGHLLVFRRLRSSSGIQ